MHIHSVHLGRFRNFKNQDIEFGSGVNFFFGDNGQGKTNLMEAIQILLLGRSFRQGGTLCWIPNSMLIRNNDSFPTDLSTEYAKAARQINTRQGSFTQTSPGDSFSFSEPLCYLSGEIYQEKLLYQTDFLVFQDGKKKHRLNRKPWSPLHRGLFSVVCFHPESLFSLKSGGEARRDLLDEMVSLLQPHFSKLMGNYRKCLKTRNSLLRSLADKKEDKAKTGEFNEIMGVLEGLNTLFLELSTEVSLCRLEVLRKVIPLQKRVFEEFTGLGLSGISRNGHLGWEYLISKENHQWSDQAKLRNSLKRRMEELREAEIHVGYSLLGPHRHEMDFLIDGRSARFYCSQGQQRAIVIALKMAQIVYHRELRGFDPILILDDVLSELDSGIQESLVGFLNQMKTQIFLTSTGVEYLPFLKQEGMVVRRIRRGVVEK